MILGRLAQLLIGAVVLFFVVAFAFSCLTKGCMDATTPGGINDLMKTPEPEETDAPHALLPDTGITKKLDSLIYDGSLVITLSDDVPFFGIGELTSLKAGEYALSEKDVLGRCGPAVMMAVKSAMPTGERGSTGTAKPTGWKQNKYAGIVDSNPPYLYNRCHLLMWALSGLTDDTRNLITGTRCFNKEGMLAVETEVIKAVENGKTVLYRVTPHFKGDDLLASGVLMEALSVDGTFSLCRYVFNVQPGVKIDYATGDNKLAPGYTLTVPTADTDDTPVDFRTPAPEVTYVININSMKFHLPTCESIPNMSSRYRADVTWTLDECRENGYGPCKICNPDKQN